MKWVENEFPKSAGLRSTINLCFGAANNLAIQGVERRYVILPTADAFLCPNSLRGTVPDIIYTLKRRWRARGLWGGTLYQPSARPLRLPAIGQVPSVSDSTV
jgi:hypothetical protein